jgi:hypothetical protein
MKTKEVLSIKLAPPLASDLVRFSQETGVTPNTFASQCVEAAIAERRLAEMPARPEEASDGF